MTTLYIEDYPIRTQLESLIRQVEYLNALDKSIQSVHGQTDESPLDKAIDDLLNSFLYFSGISSHCNKIQIDKIIDHIFEDPYEEKFNDVFKILESVT